MWNNPRLANATATSLYLFAFGLLGYAALRLVAESAAFPLRTIVVEGDLRHVARSDIVSALQGRVTGGFFDVDLESIRALFEGVPWVRRADVRRGWPDRLEVRIEEHVALARWQGRQPRLVNTHGELFSGRVEGALPVFSGPPGSEAEIARLYASIHELLAPLELESTRVSLSSRLAWQLRLSNGLTVQLGRDTDKDRVNDRFAKFVAVYPQTVRKLPRAPDYVDLRYPNGFALRVPDAPKAGIGKAGRERV
ncbi:MAG: cell division protein FtsQ/DivIB [Burkholderiales bacterium]